MGWKAVILVGIVGLLLSFSVHLDHSHAESNALTAYQAEAEQQSLAVGNKFEKTMQAMYRGIRTIARLPAVRNIARHDNPLTPDALQSIQELYNNLISEVTMSELYIVPVDFEPDLIDIHTGKYQEPIITFDDFIVGRLAGDNTSASTHEETPEYEIVEIEIFEYRLMKQQLAWLKENYPTENNIDRLDYPALTGPEVVTCDNRYFNPQSPNDADRSGLVYSVPFYNLDGVLKGCITAVILTREIGKLLPSDSYAIRNIQHNYTIKSLEPHPTQQTCKFVESGQPDPNLYYSHILNLNIVDGSSSWVLWTGLPNSQFLIRDDLANAHQAMIAKYLGVFILTIGLWIVLFLVNKNQHLIAAEKCSLERQVKERTADLVDSETRTNAILNCAANAIVTIDNKGMISTFNRAAEEIFGYDAFEIIGWNVSKLVPQPDKEHHDKYLKNYLLTGISKLIGNERELEGLRKDGSKVQLTLRVTEFKSQSGQWFVGTMQDITERKNAEANQEEMHLELQTTAAQLEEQKAQLVNEIDQRMRSEATARHDATHDILTGLSNRAMLIDRIEESLMRSKSDTSYKFALLFLDFDRFKLVNDSLGHNVGDQLLISIAKRLNKNLRSDDLAQSIDDNRPERNLPARIGGDEFVILLDHIGSISDAIHVAERVQKVLESPHKLGKHEVTSTASIGIVISDSAYNSADEMLRDADTAMYSAKAAGKAQHKVFDKAMHDQATDRLQLENDLRTALQKEQFRIVYQPIVDLETGQITGFEALIRWDHPTRGLISPIDFIPVAEETGLIVPIGGWVLLEASGQLKKWQTQFPRKEPLSMNVNISKRQLTQPDLVSTVENVLHSFDIPAHTLKLEVTESAIMSDMEQLAPILQSLRNLGLHLCIDDFGTGQSSLSCLHMFAIDVLKIDRYFLVTMGESREYAAVTEAIVTLAHNLRMTVVAEGVETAGQLAQLQALGADMAQGYFFSKPVKPEEIETLLKNAAPLIKSAA